MTTSEQISPELLVYFQEITTLLAYQGHNLSVSGLSHGRSRLSQINDYTWRVLQSVVDRDESILPKDTKLGYFEYLEETEKRIAQKSIVALWSIYHLGN